MTRVELLSPLDLAHTAPHAQRVPRRCLESSRPSPGASRPNAPTDPSGAIPGSSPATDGSFDR